MSSCHLTKPQPPFHKAPRFEKRPWCELPPPHPCFRKAIVRGSKERGFRYRADQDPEAVGATGVVQAVECLCGVLLCAKESMINHVHPHRTQISRQGITGLARVGDKVKALNVSAIPMLLEPLSQQPPLPVEATVIAASVGRPCDT
jgi:hypothetical protein